MNIAGWSVRANLKACRLLIAFVLLTPLVLSCPAGAQTYKVLHNFGSGSDGLSPSAGLTPGGPSGSFYGTTSSGGTYKQGTIFSITKAGKMTVLYNFGSQQGDPSDSTTNLLLSKGILYGTSEGGGSGTGGTIFSFAPSGGEGVLYSFQHEGDGGGPSALVTDGKGNLYGATSSGGNGGGNIFEFTGGNLVPLHEFAGAPDGFGPLGVVRDSNGILYGSTFLGDTENYGMVFKYNPSTKKEKDIGDFGKCCGALGTGPMILGPANTLYGVTAFSAFKISTSGKSTVLHAFCSGQDGCYPYAALTLDKQGNVYGTTLMGGTGPCELNQEPGCGVVFKISKSGHETVLHNFCTSQGCPDGAYPTSNLYLDSEGNLYGTANYGGKYGYGVAFKITLKK